MGKKNKKQKDDLEIKDTKKDPTQEEDNDKVSIKKTFRDTGIIMALLAVVTGIVVFVNRDALDPNYQRSKADENEENIDEADPEIAYKNLISLANKQLVDTRHLNSNLEHVSGLVSLEYTTNRIVFCALGDKQDDDNYLVKITMNHTFELPGDFVYQMTNLKLNSAVSTYGVSCEVMNVYNNEAINDKFDESKLETLINFDESKIFKHKAYRADGSEDAFFSVTYAGIDSKIHSINAMEYNTATNDFTIASEYSISPSDSEKMYDLFNIILESE